MLYTVIGILAIALHVILNYRYIFGDKRGVNRGFTSYLMVVLAYYVTDMLWGALDSIHLMIPLYIDTMLYFVAMAFSTFFWCRYVVSDCALEARSGRLLIVTGYLFCVFEIVAQIVNCFVPLYFEFDSFQVYHPLILRYVSVAFQVVLLAMASVEIFIAARRNRQSLSRRALIMGLFCIVMIAAVIIQVLHSLYPLYTMGLMVGSSMFSVFVQKDEEDKYRSRILANEEKLRENGNILANAGYGIWKIQMKPDGRHLMVADEKLQEILGVKGMNLSPEELYSFYHGRLEEDVASIESEDYRNMEKGDVSTRILLWNHPERGNIYIYAGGSSYTTYSGEEVISGFCGDVTTQRKQDLRSRLIINTLARSYEFLHYIKMDTMTYIAASSSIYTEDDDISDGDVLKAISFSCEQRVAPEFRKEMMQFADLSTIDVRMKHRNMIINQFKDIRGIWHEWSYVVADRREDGTVKHLIWALRKIEDEKQAEIRKQQIIDDNIAANRAKTVFLQNMSHEIRTPLNTMFGFAQLLGLPDGTWTGEEKQQYNSYILNSYNMLDMLIGDIIDVADSEHGNYRIELTDVAVNDVCRNALVTVEYRVPQGVRLYFTSEIPDSHHVTSDGKRIQQVLVNYLTNACKHTTEGEIHLHCSASEHPGKLTFSVTDTGIGVPKDKAELIFKRFIKLNQFAQGSGLGLNICLMIADKLGGKVYLDKEYTGGARFVFVIDDKTTNSIQI